jgi:hypothetical protein
MAREVWKYGSCYTLINYLHAVPRLRMRRTIPLQPLDTFMAWTGTIVLLLSYEDWLVFRNVKPTTFLTMRLYLENKAVCALTFRCSLSANTCTTTSIMFLLWRQTYKDLMTTWERKTYNKLWYSEMTWSNEHLWRNRMSLDAIPPRQIRNIAVSVPVPLEGPCEVCNDTSASVQRRGIFWLDTRLPSTQWSQVDQYHNVVQSIISVIPTNIYLTDATLLLAPHDTAIWNYRI